MYNCYLKQKVTTTYDQMDALQATVAGVAQQYGLVIPSDGLKPALLNQMQYPNIKVVISLQALGLADMSEVAQVINNWDTWVTANGWTKLQAETFEVTQ